MTKPTTILQESAPGGQIILINKLPLALIDFMTRSRERCGKYLTKGKDNAKNTNPAARALDTWIILKTLTTSGKIHNYRQQLDLLMSICKVRKGSLTTRIKWLKQHNLVHVEGKHLHLHGYKTLETELGIDITERIKLPLIYDTTDSASLEERIYAIGIDRYRERCKYMYNKKMNACPETYNEIKVHAVAWDAKKDKMSNPEYARQSHLKLQTLSYRHKKIADKSYDLVHECDANPDVNISQYAYGVYMGTSVFTKKCPKTGKEIRQSMGAGHIIRRLAKKDLITSKQAHVESEWRARKDEKVYNIGWNNKSKVTIWFRPNTITVNYKNLLVAEKTA